jgi:hypothetical protein
MRLALADFAIIAYVSEKLLPISPVYTPIKGEGGLKVFNDCKVKVGLAALGRLSRRSSRLL